ncbi:hypothetical protein ACFRR7_03280 [Streptomyces sp. NPDC056909]
MARDLPAHPDYPSVLTRTRQPHPRHITVAVYGHSICFVQPSAPAEAR